MDTRGCSTAVRSRNILGNSRFAHKPKNQPPAMARQIGVGLELSAGTNVGAKAASLIKASRYRDRASRLSRGAATDHSHGRKGVDQVPFKTEPRRGQRFARNLSPLRGSYQMARNPRACGAVAQIDLKASVDRARSRGLLARVQIQIKIRFGG
jgi:hypothetical protein